MKRVLVATSNPGKIRDLVGAAAAHDVQVETLAGFSSLPAVIEDGLTFEANARKKAEHYSKYAEGELVIADDSRTRVDALGGAPGFARHAMLPMSRMHRSTRRTLTTKPIMRAFCAELHEGPQRIPHWPGSSVLSPLARNGHTLATF